MIDIAIFVTESLCVRLSVLEVSQCSPSLLLAVRLNYKHCVNHLPSHLSPSPAFLSRDQHLLLSRLTIRGRPSRLALVHICWFLFSRHSAGLQRSLSLGVGAGAVEPLTILLPLTTHRQPRRFGTSCRQLLQAVTHCHAGGECW